MVTYQRQLDLARRLREYLAELGADAALYSITLNFHTIRDAPSDDDPASRRDVELTVEAADPLAFAEAFQARHGGGIYVGMAVYVFGEASTAVRWRLRVIPTD